MLSKATGTAGFYNRDQETLTWSNQKSISFTVPSPAPAELNAGLFPSGQQQITRVQYERPTVWLVQIVLDLVLPDTETQAYLVQYPVIIGVGMTSISLTKQKTVTAADAPQVLDSFQVPAQSIQIGFIATPLNVGSPLAGPHSLTLAAIVAPLFV